MPSISTVELTNTFDEWRSRTNDIITVINAANSTDPTTAITYANSEGGFAVNTVTTNSITGTLMTGTRLVLTGGNVNFTSANVVSGGNVHQVHVLGGTSIDVSTPADADSSISNTFVYNSKIHLNGQKFVSGAAAIDLNGATISNLGSVSKLTSVAAEASDVSFTNPTIAITSGAGSLTISSGTQDFSGATIASSILSPYIARAGVVETSNVVVNGAGFLVSTNSTAFGLDVGTANVGIGKFPEISTNITSEKRPTSSKGRVHIRTNFAAGGTTATAVESSADELVLENTGSLGNASDGVGLTLLAGDTKNAHVAFGDPSDTDVGGILYNHATETMHIVTDAANTAVFGNEYGGYMQIVGGDTIGAQSGKLHINVGSTDGTSGIYIDSNDADKQGISIAGSQTTAHMLNLSTETQTTGDGLHIYDNSADTGVRSLLELNQNHQNATGGTALYVKTDGMTGVEVRQNKATRSGLILSTDTAHTAKLAQIIHDHTGTTGDTLYVKSDSTTTSQKVLEVANSSASVITAVAGGSVGFNVSDPNPTYKIDVGGAVRISNDLQVGGALYMADKLAHIGDTDTYIQFGVGTINFITDNDSQLYMDGGQTFLRYNGATHLSTDSAGVDITGRLDISGVINATSNSPHIFGNEVYVGSNIRHNGDTDTYMTFNGENSWALYTGNDAAFSANESTAYMYYNGTWKLATLTDGVTINGTKVCASGVECRLAVYNASGTLLNSC